ncbi:hypothetical protein J3R83DRAFT_5508 [Lanmaoa asiatica]|nr:hypothetical protein J3R83DRAFT_5508 [Lanmaoa asiatica]
MHRIDDWIYDVSNHIRLGGVYARELAGPTPRGLVPPDILSVQPPGDFPLPPQHTRHSVAALDPENWRM